MRPAEGRVGEDSYHGVWGGVRFYFGQKDKTLIRRHREDDPTNWNNGADSTFNGGSQTPASAPSCPVGYIRSGNACVPEFT